MYNSLLGGAYAPPVKRKAFFSFNFEDVMRVNNVRNGWKITHADSAAKHSFYDSSLWESKKLEGDDAVKRLIREGVCNTSAVCVLVGTHTWNRRWVRYEIARAVVDKRGLLAVHINGLKHHKELCAHSRGPNPLAFMAVGKVQDNVLRPATYYLFEQRYVNGAWGWYRYKDYTQPVELPQWLPDCKPGFVSALSLGAAEHDYVAGRGHENIGRWIDAAAKAAGR